MAYDDIPEEFRPLDLTEGKTTSLGAPVLGGEALSTKLEREATEAENAQGFLGTLGITGEDETTETIAEGVVDAFTSGGNYAVDILDSYRRSYDNPYDPNFNPEKWLNDNRVKEQIGENYLSTFMSTGSQAEAEALVKDIRERELARQRMARMGITGQLTATMLAGMFDIDTLVSGGAAIAGKAGLMSTRVGQLLSSAGTGALAATVGETASPDGDYSNVALAALIGGAIGGYVGPSSKADPLADGFNAAVADGLDELDEHIQRRQRIDPAFDPDEATSYQPFAKQHAYPEPEPAQKPTETPASAETREPVAIDPSKVTMDVGEDVWEAGRRSGDAGSIGARQLPGRDAGLEAPSLNVQDAMDNARIYHRNNRTDDRYFYDYGAALNGPSAAKQIATGVRKVVDVISKMGIKTDFDKLMKTGSPVAKMLAREFLEDGSGRMGTNRTAAAYKDLWTRQALSTWRPDFTDASNSFAKRNGIKLFQPKAAFRMRDKFNRLVFIEAENLRLSGKFSPNVDADVKRAVEALNKGYEFDAQIGRGRYITESVPGYENMKPQAGYIERRVSGANQIDLLRRTNYTEKDLVKAWQEFYAASHKLTMDHAEKVAKMVVSRAKAKDRGTNMMLYGMLQEDGQEFLSDALKAQGMTDNDIQSVLRALVGAAEERGQAGHTKGRLDGDIRFVASNGIKIIDLIDTDIEGLLTKRAYTTAGRAAAARKGIRTQKEMDTYINAVLHEMQNKVQDTPSLTDVLKSNQKVNDLNDWLDADQVVDEAYLRKLLKDQFFGGEAITDGQEMMVARAKRAAVLATMNGLGLTQLAESGVLMGAMGFREFVKQLPAAFKSDLTNPRSALIQEFKSVGTLVPEEKLFNPRYMADFDLSLHAQSEQAQVLDRLMGKALEVQGMISGMNKVREAQQRMAVMSVTDRFFQQMMGHSANPISRDRLSTMGFDTDLLARLQGIQKHLEWDGDNVKRLNFSKWNDPELVEDFVLAINRATDQSIQRARIGEGSLFLSGNGIVGMMTQFLSYPLTAMTKQTARNAYIGDAEAVYSAFYGFLAAGMIGTAKAVVAGRYEDLEPTKFARNGFVQANLTGWIPMVSDPLVTLFGMDSLSFNPYSNDVVRTPPIFDLANRMLRAPQAVAGILTGNLDREDKSSLRALPLIGNWYGMTALMNRL
ncbi:putative internal virion protein [Rhizobium phage RHph_X3_9]|nr:putative internal virion protein [Rhizobium phage RHph_X3_9]